MSSQSVVLLQAKQSQAFLTEVMAILYFNFVKFKTFDVIFDFSAFLLHPTFSSEMVIASIFQLHIETDYISPLSLGPRGLSRHHLSPVLSQASEQISLILPCIPTN